MQIIQSLIISFQKMDTINNLNNINVLKLYIARAQQFCAHLQNVFCAQIKAQTILFMINIRMTRMLIFMYESQ